MVGPDERGPTGLIASIDKDQEAQEAVGMLNVDHIEAIQSQI